MSADTYGEKHQMELESLDTTQVTSNRARLEDSPIISAIVSCYNVEPFLDDFLANLDRQAVTYGAIELVFVVDGSPDKSASIIARWMETSPHPVTLAVQANKGLSGARNTGIQLSRGAWVTFPDADDWISENYFSNVLSTIQQFPDSDMFTTRLVRRRVSGARGEHALEYRYNELHTATQFWLDDRPEMIHLHSNMAFLRRETLNDLALRFDERLRKGFEDAHLIAKYLLNMDRPGYVLIPQAEYNYVAHPGSITAQPDYAKYIDIISVAYFDLLTLTNNERPNWLAYLLLYDLWWLFKEHLNMLSPVHGLKDDERNTLNSLTRSVLGQLDVEQVRSFRIINVPLDVRSAWEAATSPGSESHMAVLRSHDRTRRLQKVAFHSSDPEAKASVILDNAELDVAFTKVREILFFDVIWMFEHIYWVDVHSVENRVYELRLVGETDGLNFLFDGKAHDARTSGRLLGKMRYPRERRASNSSLLQRKVSHLRWKGRRLRERASYSIPYRIGALLGWRRKFANAWVMIDRDIQANDNAEALYRYTVRERKDLNAWFVINKTSPDFARLKKAGFKLVAYGSKKHFSLMKEARVLASSMLDHYVLFPFPRKYLPKTWTYSFLQHGVIHNRLHRWLNFKDIDHLVTSTQPEFDSIAGSPSPYKLSHREVVLTGMPRHDRLAELSERHQVVNDGVTRVLLMPTWRNYLFGEATGGSREKIEGFSDTTYVRQWSKFFNSDYIRELCVSPDTEVTLLPHPNIDSHWSDLPVPPGMKRVSYVGDDVQAVIASSDLVVTDYSSQAFEGAFCGAPTVYFQFDRDEFFAGGHVASTGYFDHRRDGFGPVCLTVSETENAVRSMVERTHPEIAKYEQRISELYPFKDGRASQRVIETIERRMVPYSNSSQKKH